MSNLFLTNSARQMSNLHLATLWKAIFFFFFFFWYQDNGFILVKQNEEPLNYNEVSMHAQLLKSWSSLL